MSYLLCAMDGLFERVNVPLGIFSYGMNTGQQRLLIKQQHSARQAKYVVFWRNTSHSIIIDWSSREISNYGVVELLPHMQEAMPWFGPTTPKAVVSSNPAAHLWVLRNLYTELNLIFNKLFGDRKYREETDIHLQSNLVIWNLATTVQVLSLW